MLQQDEAGYTYFHLVRSQLDNHPWMIIDPPGLGSPVFSTLGEYNKFYFPELNPCYYLCCYIGKRDENHFVHIDESVMDIYFKNKEEFYSVSPWELAISKAVPLYVENPTSIDMAFNLSPNTSIPSQWRLDKKVQRNFAQLDAIWRDFKRLNKTYGTDFHFTTLGDEEIQNLLNSYLR